MRTIRDRMMMIWLRRSPAADRWALVLLRLVVGFGFVAHGYAKLARGPESFAAILSAIGVPAPRLAAWATVVVELLGGIAMMAGAGVVVVTPLLAAVMLTALFGVHLRYGFSAVRLKAITDMGAEFGPIGYELNLLYLAALATLAASSPSARSIDRWLARRMDGRAPEA
jgi:putative oxidoreductase